MESGYARDDYALDVVALQEIIVGLSFRVFAVQVDA